MSLNTTLPQHSICSLWIYCCIHTFEILRTSWESDLNFNSKTCFAHFLHFCLIFDLRYNFLWPTHWQRQMNLSNWSKNHGTCQPHTNRTQSRTSTIKAFGKPHCLLGSGGAWWFWQPGQVSVVPSLMSWGLGERWKLPQRVRARKKTWYFHILKVQHASQTAWSAISLYCALQHWTNSRVVENNGLISMHFPLMQLNTSL